MKPLSEVAGPQGKDARRLGDFCPHFSPAPGMWTAPMTLLLTLQQKKLEEEEVTAVSVKRMKEDRDW